VSSVTGGVISAGIRLIFTGSWEGTQSVQLTQTDQMHIQYLGTSHYVAGGVSLLLRSGLGMAGREIVLYIMHFVCSFYQ